MCHPCCSRNYSWRHPHVRVVDEVTRAHITQRPREIHANHSGEETAASMEQRILTPPFPSPEPPPDQHHLARRSDAPDPRYTRLAPNFGQVLVNEVDEKQLARDRQRAREEDEGRLAEQLRHAESLDAVKRGQVGTRTWNNIHYN